MQTAEHLAEARDAYAQTVKQPWFAGPLYVATAKLALLQGRLADADAAVAEGLRVAGSDLGFRGAALRHRGTRDRGSRRPCPGAPQRNGGGEGPVARRRPWASSWAQDVTRAAGRSGPDASHRGLCGRMRRGDCQTRRAQQCRALDVAAEAWERLAEPYPTAYAGCREAEALLLAGLSRDRVRCRCAGRTRRHGAWAPCRSPPKLRAWRAAAESPERS